MRNIRVCLQMFAICTEAYSVLGRRSFLVTTTYNKLQQPPFELPFWTFCCRSMPVTSIYLLRHSHSPVVHRMSCPGFRAPVGEKVRAQECDDMWWWWGRWEWQWGWWCHVMSHPKSLTQLHLSLGHPAADVAWAATHLRNSSKFRKHHTTPGSRRKMNIHICAKKRSRISANLQGGWSKILQGVKTIIGLPCLRVFWSE